MGLVLWMTSHAAAEAPTPSAADVEFFETSVRPVLIERCSECHGPEEQWSGLRVDSREALLRGGDRGPAIVPGNPDESLLIKAIRQSGSLQMPDGDKLADEQIAALERWVKRGAVWPESPLSEGPDREQDPRAHWAFQPIARPHPPAVSDASWCRTSVDTFILARLEDAGLAPSPPADRRTLIRRATYDLTGLPPTPAEVDAFVNNPAPTAYEALIERLLESPHYGEHWARHWLDVARYADTKGYVLGREGFYYVHSSAYRDWVVRAFNEDLPYDRFLLLQMAADHAADDRSALAAMGFLTLNSRFLGVQHEIINDRIDVISRGTMGLTVACARCHDHKYDPIPTADYYSLYGVFQNSIERRMPVTTPDQRVDSAFEKELQKRLEAQREAMTRERNEVAQRARQRVTDYLLAQLESDKVLEANFIVQLAPEDIVPGLVRRWRRRLAEAAATADPVFLAWTEFADLPSEEFAERAAEASRKLTEGGANVNPLVAEAFADPPSTMREVAQRYGELFANVHQQWTELCARARADSLPEPDALPDPAAEALRQALYGPRSPCVVPDEWIGSIERFFPRKTFTELWKLQKSVDDWLIQSTERPTHTVALVDRTWMEEPYIFRRGNPALSGGEVSRHFLSVIAGPEPEPFMQGSGRLELARAIIDPDNPLTARVWANRVWMHHFGQGLVRTPSDFGLRSEGPSHPQLLDWLARQLTDNGWSTKRLHRLIMLSAAYQQQSSTAANSAAGPAAQVDPENHLLWRMNSRRLTWEQLRDTLLAVSGELDVAIGGRAEELFGGERPNLRRTIYGLVDRRLLPSVFRVFDFANPDLHIPERTQTTIPQQALFLLNHPFVADRARALAAGSAVSPPDDPAHRVRRLFAMAYQRDPTQFEVQASLSFLKEAVVAPQPALRPETLTWQYGYGSLDDTTGRVQGFHPLAHFTGSAWLGGPDGRQPDSCWVRLTAEGGVVEDTKSERGEDPYAAIRRWTAPHDCRVCVTSVAVHDAPESEGIRCWIISSREGILASAAVQQGPASLDVEALDVRAGEVLDFVVRFLGEGENDPYTWAPVIRELPAHASAAEGDAYQTWDASRDFSGPAAEMLGPWEQLAQALLLGNELMFVD